MAAPGIIGTVQLAATLVLALPLVLFGLVWLVDGRPAGAAFVGVGIFMILLQRYLTNPLDPGDVAEAVVDYVAGDDE